MSLHQLTRDLTTGVTLLLTCAHQLFVGLFCPVVIGVLGHQIFDPVTVVGQLVTLTCFVWAARNFWIWWNTTRVMMRVVFTVPWATPGVRIMMVRR